MQSRQINLGDMKMCVVYSWALWASEVYVKVLYFVHQVQTGLLKAVGELNWIGLAEWRLGGGKHCVSEYENVASVLSPIMLNINLRLLGILARVGFQDFCNNWTLKR